MSVPAAALKISAPFRIRQLGAGRPAGSSGNGKLGNFKAVTWVVSHDMRPRVVPGKVAPRC